MHHSVLFDALVSCNVDVHVVGALRRLYKDMKATVQLQPGIDSRTFSVQRGVRQGDPLSPVLFNLVMTSVLAEVDTIWQRRGYGSNVGQDFNGRRLTHVAFADDMTLIARSWISLKRMLAMLRGALSKRGLDLHPSKCKAQTNLTDWALRGEVSIDVGFCLGLLRRDDHAGPCLFVRHP